MSDRARKASFSQSRLIGNFAASARTCHCTLYPRLVVWKFSVVQRVSETLAA
jgi:hypothetical protein